MYGLTLMMLHQTVQISVPELVEPPELKSHGLEQLAEGLFAEAWPPFLQQSVFGA